LGINASDGEYAYNNSKYSATKISPFYVNYGFEPRTNWPMEVQFRNPASELYGHYMNAIHKTLSEQLVISIEAMKIYYNKKRKDIEQFNPGDLVMLRGKNIRAKHRCEKLEDKMYRPFEVLSSGINGRYYTL